MKDIEKLILFLQEEYKIVCKEWKQSSNYNNINMRKKLVHDLYNSEELFLNILNYRDFIGNKFDLMYTKVKKLGINGITFRIKAINSIQYKIENYEKNHEYGKIPINKCLNDIYGFRIICDENIEFDKIRSMINDKFSNIKCISGSKGEYIATHLYFGKGNNYDFPWELQIWNKKHKESNYLSHYKYKQEYTKWEKENKGGV